MPVSLSFMSDLHLDVGDFTPPETDADIVVLAGDIHAKQHAMPWIRQHFADKQVVYVPGNHEYYGAVFPKHLQKLKDAAPRNVHVLDRGEVVLNGVRFLGATLWTDYALSGNVPLAMWDARRNMNDYQRITYHSPAGERYRKLQPEDLLHEHAESVFWLASKLAVPFPGATVVVTHHAPSTLSLDDYHYQGSGTLDACYASRLEHLFGDQVTLWVHGHTHATADYTCAGTRVISNPRGYSFEQNLDFDPEWIIPILGYTNCKNGRNRW